LNQLSESGINFIPDLVRHDRFERRLRNFDGKIELPVMADIDDRAIRIAAVIDIARSNQKSRDLFDRFLRGRKSDALQRLSCQRSESLDAQSEMGAATIVHD